MADYFISSVADATPTPEAPSGYDLGNDSYDGTSPTFLGGSVGPKLTANIIDTLSATGGNTFYINGDVEVDNRTRLRASINIEPSGNSSPSSITLSVGHTSTQAILSFAAASASFDGAVWNIGAITINETNSPQGSIYMVPNASPGLTTINFNGTVFGDVTDRPWRGSGSINTTINGTNISFIGTPTAFTGCVDGVTLLGTADCVINGVFLDISANTITGNGGLSLIANSGSTVTIDNVTGSITAAVGSSNTWYGARIREAGVAAIRGMDVDLNQTDRAVSASQDFIDMAHIASNTTATDAPEISGLRGTINAYNGHVLVMGRDGGASTITNPIVDDIDVSGPAEWASGLGTLHGVTIGGTSGGLGTCTNFNIERANFLVVSKENTAKVAYSGGTGGYITGRGYYAKGDTDTDFTGNRIDIYDGFVPAEGCLDAGETDGGVPDSSGVVFDSNLVYIHVGTDTTGIKLTRVGNGTTDLSSATFQDNNYYSEDGPIPDAFNYHASTNLSLEDWNLLPQVSNDGSFNPSSGAPILPYSIGTNNGPLFTIKTSDTLSTIEGAGFFDGNAAYASLLKTGDVLLIEASNGTKLYNVTVEKISRTITLSSGTEIV